jgi:hypothetical protein
MNVVNKKLQKQFVSLLLSAVLLIAMCPVSVTDLFAGASVLGSVGTASGGVELRGAALSRDRSVFAGDRISSGSDSRATVSLAEGRKLVLGSNTDLIIGGNESAIQVDLRSGYSEFSSERPGSISISVAPDYEILANGNTAGYVVVGQDSFGVRALRGSVTVKNLRTREARVLKPAPEQQTYAMASLVVPRTPTAGTSTARSGGSQAGGAGGAAGGGAGLSTLAIVGIVAAVGAAATVAIVKIKDDDNSPSRP